MKRRTTRFGIVDTLSTSAENFLLGIGMPCPECKVAAKKKEPAVLHISATLNRTAAMTTIRSVSGYIIDGADDAAGRCGMRIAAMEHHAEDSAHRLQSDSHAQ